MTGRLTGGIIFCSLLMGLFAIGASLICVSTRLIKHCGCHPEAAGKSLKSIGVFLEDRAAGGRRVTGLSLAR
jgi:hypothetical protein